MRLLRAHGSAELEKAASCSATQGLWLGDRKSGISANRQRLKPTPWERNSWKVKRGGRRPGDRTKEREWTDLGLDLGEREEQAACHASALALAMTDEACRQSEM